MVRVFVTGSTDGLGRAAAQELLDAGHDVIVHARHEQRAQALADLRQRGAGLVTGDLSDLSQVRALADQVNAIARMDAVIHNAGVIGGPELANVNVVAPYLLTALIDLPARLIYLSSSMHRGGRAQPGALNPREGGPDLTYSDSKLCVTALAAAVARLHPETLSNAVDPGWVPTSMGGPEATDDLRLGHVTQTWLAVSEDPRALTSGGYWHHQRRQDPHPAVQDVAFQDAVIDALAAHTGRPMI